MDKGLPGMTTGQVIPTRANSRFEGMSQGVHSSSGTNGKGLGKGKLGIQKRKLWQSTRISAGHFPVRMIVRNQGIRLALTSRTCSGRNRDHREQRLGCLRHTPIIFHRTTIGQDKICPLGGVE